MAYNVNMKPWIKVGLLIVVLVVVAALAMRYARPLLDFLGNEQLIQAWLDQHRAAGAAGPDCARRPAT